jgi:hypothetical protein
MQALLRKRLISMAVATVSAFYSAGVDTGALGDCNWIAKTLEGQLAPYLRYAAIAINAQQALGVGFVRPCCPLRHTRSLCPLLKAAMKS